MTSPENIISNQNENKEEKKIESRELSVEKFAEIIVQNGNLLSSSLTDQEVMNYSRVNGLSIKKEKFTDSAKGVYSFNGGLYLVQFKVEKVDERYSNSRNITIYMCTLTPDGVERLEIPNK